jgi:hypothetical protein
MSYRREIDSKRPRKIVAFLDWQLVVNVKKV